MLCLGYVWFVGWFGCFDFVDGFVGLGGLHAAVCGGWLPVWCWCCW